MTDLIPAHVRAHIYAAFAFFGVALGGVQVGYAAAELGQPVWLTVALAVYGFVGGALGLTARANTPEVDVPGGPVDSSEAHLLADIRQVEGRDTPGRRHDDA